MFCRKCGSKMNDGAMFCTNCGWKVEGSNNKPKTVNLRLLISTILGIVVIVVVLFNVLIGGKNHTLPKEWLKNCPYDVTKVEVINFQEGGSNPNGEKWKMDNKGLNCYVTEKEIVVCIPKNHKLYAPKDSSYLFSLKQIDAEKEVVGDDYFSLKEINNLDLLDTSKVINMKGMFLCCYDLVDINVSKFDTSKVTDMSHMFLQCRELVTIDVSKWDTSKVIDMNRMFYNCTELTTLDVSKWDTGKVTDMSEMFRMIGKMIDGKYINPYDRYYVEGIKDIKLTKLDVSRWDTSKVTNMARMFKACLFLEKLDVSRWDTSNIENMEGMDLHSYISYSIIK